MSVERTQAEAPRLERIIGYDFAASFGPDSPGRRNRRLIDIYGESHLGQDAWRIGERAYELLSRSNASDMSELDLARQRHASKLILDELFEKMRPDIDSGQIRIIIDDQDHTSEQIDWPTANWTWKVQFMVDIVCGLRAFNAGAETESELSTCCLIAVFTALDDAVILSVLGDTESSSDYLLDAVRFLDHVEGAERIQAAASERLKALDSLRASERAKHRHAVDPKRKARDFVQNCWRTWREQPEQYSSAAAFARDMLDKFPEDLTSEVVITRWVREWDKGLK